MFLDIVNEIIFKSPDQMGFYNLSSKFGMVSITKTNANAYMCLGFFTTKKKSLLVSSKRM